MKINNENNKNSRDKYNIRKLIKQNENKLKDIVYIEDIFTEGESLETIISNFVRGYAHEYTMDQLLELKNQLLMRKVDPLVIDYVAKTINEIRLDEKYKEEGKDFINLYTIQREFYEGDTKFETKQFGEYDIEFLYDVSNEDKITFVAIGRNDGFCYAKGTFLVDKLMWYTQTAFESTLCSFLYYRTGADNEVYYN